MHPEFFVTCTCTLIYRLISLHERAGTTSTKIV